MKTIFWISLSIIFYVYFAYPVIVYFISLFYKKTIKKENFYPSVSIIISAHNEEDNIENKIRSLLELDYPNEKIEVLIGSDGSTDNTDAILSQHTNGAPRANSGYPVARLRPPQADFGEASASFSTKEATSRRSKNRNSANLCYGTPPATPASPAEADEKIKVFSKRNREGKPSMLNMLASKAKGEILIFTDARQRLDKDSLKELVSNISDKNIGSASAELFFENENNKAGNGISLYWQYEKFIRSHESKIGSMLGATGAMYAIRKKLYCELPKDLILDDVYIPLKTVQNGYRAIFEPNAHIYDKVVKNSKEEFSRKTRTLSGNFQIFVYLKELFNPFKSPVAFQLFSHKFLRLFIPFFLMIIFISNIFILNTYLFRITLTLQIIFYSFAIFGSILKLKNRLFDIPHMFCVMNLAAIAGLWRFSTRNQDVMWEKTS